MSELALHRTGKTGGSVVSCSKFYGHFGFNAETYLVCSSGSGSFNVKPDDAPNYSSNYPYASLDGTSYNRYPQITYDINHWHRNESDAWSNLSSASNAQLGGALMVQGHFDQNIRRVYTGTSLMVSFFEDVNDSVACSTKVQFQDISDTTKYEVGTGTLTLTITLKKDSGNKPYFKVDWTYSGDTTVSLAKNSSSSAVTREAVIGLTFVGHIFCGEE